MNSWAVIEILRKSDYRNMEKYKKTKREQQKRYYHKTQDAPNKRKYWTDEEKEQLRTMFEAGFGITKIAYILCRTEPAVYQQIESMDLYNRKANPQRRRSAAKPRGCLCENCLCDSSFCPRCMKEQNSEGAVANV